MRMAGATSCGVRREAGVLYLLSDLILEAIYLRKEGLIPFITTHGWSA
jgi:hypothetical protein